MLTKGLFTPGNVMHSLWSNSYPIVKRPCVNALRNAFKKDLNALKPIQEVAWDALQMKLNSFKCVYSTEIKEQIYIRFADTHLCYKMYMESF